MKERVLIVDPRSQNILETCRSWETALKKAGPLAWNIRYGRTPSNDFVLLIGQEQDPDDGEWYDTDTYRMRIV